MTVLRAFVASPLAGALGWALLHSLWQGVAAAVVLASILLATRSPRVRYVAGCLAILAMLGALLATAVRMLPHTEVQANRAPVYRIIAMDGRSDAPAAASPELNLVVHWLPPFWLLGMAGFSLRYAVGVAALYRLRQRGLLSAPEEWIESLARLRERLRVSRPVLLMESCLVEVPMVLGHFRPLILIPVGMLTGWPPDQVEGILAHEFAHVRRHDYLVNALQRLVESLLFYHPAIWWFSRVVRAEREKCADDTAVALHGNAREYAVALANLEKYRCGFGAPAVSASGGSLVKRIRRLTHPRQANGVWMPFLAGVVLIAASAATVLAWPQQQAPRTDRITRDQATPVLAHRIASQNGSASPTESSGTDRSRYDKWLNEDVVYIIDDAERAAFEKLATDAERDRFVEQFWERRNPTPGAAENLFREEHYRRIAYANEHFACSVPGWRTDRGHMYLAWGPPDEIESHPTPSGNSPAFEIWTYRRVKGVGDNVSLTFVDQTGKRDYRLSPGKTR